MKRKKCFLGGTLLLFVAALPTVTVAGTETLTILNKAISPENRTLSFDLWNTTDQVITAWRLSLAHDDGFGKSRRSILDQDFALSPSSLGDVEPAVQSITIERPIQPGEVVSSEWGIELPDEGHDNAALGLRVAAVVFEDTERLESLEAISHPAINEELEEVLSGLAADSIVVLDMAVLAESNLGKLASGRGYQLVIVVEAPEALRMERLVDRGHTSTEARSRMAAQASDSDRRALADHVVVNDGGLDDLTAKMQVVWKQLMRTLRAGDA